MFQQEKIDPSVMDNDNEEETISVGDYVFYDKDQVLRTEAYYVTKQDSIKGTIYLKSDYIYFEPNF